MAPGVRSCVISWTPVQSGVRSPVGSGVRSPVSSGVRGLREERREPSHPSERSVNWTYF